MNFAMIKAAMSFVAKHPEHVATFTAFLEVLHKDPTLVPDLEAFAQSLTSTDKP